MSVLQIEITVKVCEKDKDSYRLPKGIQDVTLYCVDGEIEKIKNTANDIAMALLKVAYIDYLKEVADAKLEE